LQNGTDALEALRNCKHLERLVFRAVLATDGDERLEFAKAQRGEVPAGLPDAPFTGVHLPYGDLDVRGVLREARSQIAPTFVYVILRGAGPIGAKKAVRGPTRETQGSLRSAAARRPTRGWFWWDSTRLLLSLADDPEYAGQLTGPARASPGPLMPAASPHRLSP
jgi:hypothetical protein